LDVLCAVAFLCSRNAFYREHHWSNSISLLQNIHSRARGSEAQNAEADARHSGISDRREKGPKVLKESGKIAGLSFFIFIGLCIYPMQDLMSRGSFGALRLVTSHQKTVF